MQQQLWANAQPAGYQQALGTAPSAESLALSALSLSLKNEKRVHLHNRGLLARVFPTAAGQIAVTLRDAQACFLT